MQLAASVTLVFIAGFALLVTTEHTIAAPSGFQFKMMEVVGLVEPRFEADTEYVMLPGTLERTTQLLVLVVQPDQR